MLVWNCFVAIAHLKRTEGICGRQRGRSLDASALGGVAGSPHPVSRRLPKQVCRLILAPAVPPRSGERGYAGVAAFARTRDCQIHSAYLLRTQKIVCEGLPDNTTSSIGL